MAFRNEWNDDENFILTRKDGLQGEGRRKSSAPSIYKNNFHSLQLLVVVNGKLWSRYFQRRSGKNGKEPTDKFHDEPVLYPLSLSLSFYLSNFSHTEFLEENFLIDTVLIN